MLFGNFFKKPKERPPQPPWVKWLIIGFGVFLVAQGMLKGPPNAPRNPIQQAMENAEEAITESSQKTLNYSEYKSRLFPGYRAALRILDTEIGNGPLAICGQKVTIAYNSFRADGSPIKDSASKEKPYTLRIGEGKAMPAFEQGIIGMKVGGKRSLFSPVTMSYGIPGFTRDDVASDENVRFEVELLKAEPVMQNLETAPYRIAQIQSGYGDPLLCGQKARFNLVIWDANGKKLFSTVSEEDMLNMGNYAARVRESTLAADESNKPGTVAKRIDKAISFTPGKSEVFFGLEQGVVGMYPGGVRTLVIPAIFHNTLSGKPPVIDFPLPKGQTVLVDIEYLP